MSYKKNIYSILLSIIIILSFSSCQNQNDNIDVLYTNSSIQISSSSDNNEMTSTSIDNESNNIDFDDAYLIGIWQINDVHMAAGFDDTIRFSEGGDFFYVPNTMTLSNRLVASKGKWSFDKKTNQVTLFYNQQLVIEGGVFQPEDDLDYEAYKGGKPVFKDLSNMIIELEKYIDKYSEYIEETRKTQERLITCMQLYLIGDIYAQVHNGYFHGEINYEDNSVVSWKLNDNTLKSLENFVIEYPSSKYSVVIIEYLEILHDNEQMFSKKAEKFIEDQGIPIPWS